MSLEWQIVVAALCVVSLVALFVAVQGLKAQRHILGLIGKISGLPLGASLPELTVQDKHGDIFALPDVTKPGSFLVVLSSTCAECERLFDKWHNSPLPITWLLVDSLELGASSEVPGGVQVFFAQKRREAVASLVVPSTPYYYAVDKSGQIEDKGFVSDNVIQSFKTMVNSIEPNHYPIR